MPKPVIITCAPTGGIHTPTMTPHLPITPAEIAAASIEAAEAGASIIHLHARDPETGQPDARPETFMKFLPVIKRSTDAVVNITTGGGLGMTMEERLRAATTASPEMASLNMGSINMGSINFGIFPLSEKYSDWKHSWEAPFLEMTKDYIFPNTFATIEYDLKELGDGHGTKFEFECYDIGHLHNLAWLVDKGLVKRPFLIQMVFGILGGMGAGPDHLTHMHNTADKLFGKNGYEWSVLAAGRHQMPFATQSAILGGNLRVGLEDSIYIGAGELAKSNAQQVRKIRMIIENLGLTVATPAEARERLALKGGDMVSFQRLVRLLVSNLNSLPNLRKGLTMPLVHISLRTGKSQAYRQAIFDGVYQAMRETFNVPEDDQFMTITEHDPSNFRYGASYLDIPRTDDVVFIQISAMNSRTAEQKKALFACIVKLLSKDLDMRPEDVFVNILEGVKENWSLGNGIAQYA